MLTRTSTLKTYLFVGGVADGRRISVPLHEKWLTVPEYEPATGSAYDILHTEDFSQFTPVKTHRYERKYIAFGPQGEDIITVFGLAGVPIREIIEKLIWCYPDPTTQAPR